MGDNASSLTIKELGGEERSLEFLGRALPYRPFTLKGSMRAEFTYYPGNPIATVQVLGASEQDTTLQGAWKDRFLRQQDDDGNSILNSGVVTLYDGGREQALQDVDSICGLVDDFRMKGQLLEVTWDTKVRIGLLKEFEQKWTRHEVCEWSMTFGWISRGEKEVPTNVSQTGAFDNAKGTFDNLLSGLQAVIAGAQEGIAIVESVLAEVNSYVNDIDAAVTAIDDTVNGVASSVLSVADGSKRLLGIFDTIKDDAEGLKATVQGVPSAALLSSGDVANVTFGESLNAGSWARSIADSCDDLRAQAAEQGFQISQTLDEQEILDVFNARQDTDLRDVSSRYYGTPEEWSRLMTFNGLTTSRLTAGMEILIPRLHSGGAQP